LLGTVSRYWIAKETQWAAVGIVLFDPQRWSRGIGTDALRLWCDYQFRADESLPRLDLRTWSGNERMIRLAERLGFQLEARFRDARVVDGKRYDGLGFGVLRREWERNADGDRAS
jgi:putative hydrolase of HD superfamily